MMRRSIHFLLLIVVLIHQTTASFECMGVSVGPCFNGICSRLQSSGLVCTTTGCCDSTEVKEISTGATKFKCIDRQFGGPQIPGIPCPSDTMKAVDAMGAMTCCSIRGLSPINPQPCAGK